jgi:hypothetical protein
MAQMNASTKTTTKFRHHHLSALLIALGLALFGSSMPASAQTIYDVDVANRIRGISPQVRAQIASIAKDGRAQLMAVLAKYGIDPSDRPKMNKLQLAAKELQAIERAQRAAVAPLLKPEEMAQYNSLVSETSQRIRDAMN